MKRERLTHGPLTNYNSCSRNPFSLIDLINESFPFFIAKNRLKSVHTARAKMNSQLYQRNFLLRIINKNAKTKSQKILYQSEFVDSDYDGPVQLWIPAEFEHAALNRLGEVVQEGTLSWLADESGT